MGEFREDLLLVESYTRMPVLRPLPMLPGGKVRYQLLEDYWFDDQCGEQWVIRAGYCYDGASIPTLIGITRVMTFGKFDSRVMRAAIVHDFFCDTRPETFNSSQAAELFEKMLLEDGAGKTRAAMMRRAVDMFGPHWEGLV